MYYGSSVTLVGKKAINRRVNLCINLCKDTLTLVTRAISGCLQRLSLVYGQNKLIFKAAGLLVEDLLI